MQFEPDGWDARTRLGVLTPHADVGPESELQAMAPEGVRIHAARVPFAAMAPGGAMDPTIAHAPVRAFAAPPHVDDAAERLAAAPVQAIGFGFTSSAYLIGAREEAAMLARLETRTRGIPVVATCSSAIEALKLMGADKLALLDPPWFDPTLNAAGKAYYEAAGFEVVFCRPCDLPSDQKAISPDALFEWTVANVPAAAGAVLFGGNGFRTVGVIRALEDARPPPAPPGDLPAPPPLQRDRRSRRR
jgi:maleate isomerase